MRRNNKNKNKKVEVKTTMTLFESYDAKQDSSLRGKFEASLGRAAQAIVSGGGELKNVEVKQRYDFSEKFQSEPNFQALAGQTFLSKAVDKQEITVTPDPSSATDAEIDASVSVNINDPTFMNTFFTRSSF